MHLKPTTTRGALVRTVIGVGVSALTAAAVMGGSLLATSGPTEAVSLSAPSTSSPTTTAQPSTPVPSASPTTAPETHAPPAPPPPPKILARENDTSELVRKLEARLVQLRLLDAIRVDGEYGTATTAAVQRFQAKNDLPETGKLDEVTWDAVRDVTRKPTNAELHPVIEPPKQPAFDLDERCLTGRVICVDKTARRLAWVVDGRIVDTLSTRFGREGMETREGQFSVYRMSRNHVSSIYGTSMPFAMFFNGGQAVHYSPDFAANGYNGASHGCVNVRDLGAIEAIFEQVQIGDKVVIYWS